MAGLEVVVVGTRRRGFLGFWNRVERGLRLPSRGGASGEVAAVERRSRDVAAEMPADWEPGVEQRESSKVRALLPRTSRA